MVGLSFFRWAMSRKYASSRYILGWPCPTIILALKAAEFIFDLQETPTSAQESAVEFLECTGLVLIQCGAKLHLSPAWGLPVEQTFFARQTCVKRHDPGMGAWGNTCLKLAGRPAGFGRVIA